MVLRTARRGLHAGQRFYGCSRYPGCRCILPISEAKPLPHSPVVIEKQNEAAHEARVEMVGECEEDVGRVGIQHQLNRAGGHSARSLLVDMKIAAYFLSMGLLAYGWADRNMPFSLAGASLYLLTLVVILIEAFRSSRAYRANNEVYVSPPGTVEKWLGGLITLVGLGAFCYGAPDFDDRSKDMFVIPGMMIWVGSVVSFFFVGWIIQLVAGIPLRMGYGGWYVPRRRPKRRR